MAYVNSAPSGFVGIRPVPEPSTQDEPSVNKVHGSGSTSGSAMSSSGDSSSGRSIIKSTNIWPLIAGYIDSGLVQFAYKYTGICLPSLSVIKTALIASFAAAKYMINSSRSLGAVLKKGNDFSADFDKNLFKLANFPFSFCTSLMHLGDGKLRTASALSGHALNPLVLTL
ncbi:hypothetical protein Tco_1106675 [Tanacetum coccineum]